MIGTLPTGTLPTAEISAVIYQGLTVKLANGQIGKLAILDDSGRIIDASPGVAREERGMLRSNATRAFWSAKCTSACVQDRCPGLILT